MVIYSTLEFEARHLSFCSLPIAQNHKWLRHEIKTLNYSYHVAGIYLTENILLNTKYIWVGFFFLDYTNVC